MSDPSLPDRDALLRLSAAARRRSDQLKILAGAVDPPRPAELRKALAKLAPDEPPEALSRLAAWLEAEEQGRGPRLSAELRAACRDRGIDLAVLTRSPLELRLPPLGVRVDVAADRAEVGFGRLAVERCGARADEILAARERALAELEGSGWDAAAFHRQLRQAWARVGNGGWFELADLLPALVLERQGRRFREDPTARNFSPYSRARFIYDLWRLRRDRCLLVDGWRLSLGPATGGSTRNKRRVFWLEDGSGKGQYVLTLRFVEEAALHGR